MTSPTGQKETSRDAVDEDHQGDGVSLRAVFPRPSLKCNDSGSKATKDKRVTYLTSLLQTKYFG